MRASTMSMIPISINCVSYQKNSHFQIVKTYAVGHSNNGEWFLINGQAQMHNQQDSYKCPDIAVEINPIQSNICYNCFFGT